MARERILQLLLLSLVITIPIHTRSFGRTFFCGLGLRSLLLHRFFFVLFCVRHFVHLVVHVLLDASKSLLMRLSFTVFVHFIWGLLALQLSSSVLFELYFFEALAFYFTIFFFFSC